MLIETVGGGDISRGKAKPRVLICVSPALFRRQKDNSERIVVRAEAYPYFAALQSGKGKGPAR